MALERVLSRPARNDLQRLAGMALTDRPIEASVAA